MYCGSTNSFTFLLQGDRISPLVQTSVLGKGVKHRPPPIKMPSGSGSSSSGRAEKDKTQMWCVYNKNLHVLRSIFVFTPKISKLKKFMTFCWGYMKGVLETTENHKLKQSSQASERLQPNFRWQQTCVLIASDIIF